MKTPEELAISMWNKGGHGLDLEEVVAIITADRKDMMREVAKSENAIADARETVAELITLMKSVRSIVKEETLLAKIDALELRNHYKI